MIWHRGRFYLWRSLPGPTHTIWGGVWLVERAQRRWWFTPFGISRIIWKSPCCSRVHGVAKIEGLFVSMLFHSVVNKELGLWPSRKQGGEVLHTSRQTTRGIFCVYQTKIREGGGLKPTVVYRPYFFTNFSRSWTSRAARYWSQLPASICTSIFAASATLVNQQNQKILNQKLQTPTRHMFWTQETSRQMKKLSKYKYSHILPSILNCKNKKANKQKGCLSVCTPAYIHATLVQSLSEVLHYEFPGKQMDCTWSCVRQHLYPLTTYHMDTLLNLLSREKKGSSPH